ncbi:MAG: GDP-mannose 4,6-dehydratase [Syntrophobacterales bacterium]|nr:GDP-mannose 4,6-dehydratase [Syntrophobacterales bacterium]
MSSKKMLITGGAGFIGYHCTKHFSKDYEVIVLDNLSRKGSGFNLKRLMEECSIIHEKVDVRDTLGIDEIFKRYGPFDVVIHLAAQVAVTLSVVDPRRDFEVNALGTFNVLDAFRRFSPGGLFINASTNKVYGALEDITVEEGKTRYWADNFSGIDETRNLDFHSPYGCSKGAADQYVVDYGRIYDLQTVTFRQSCIYGTQQFGVEDQGWVAWFIIAGVCGFPVTIYGSGKQVRDLLYIDDLVKLYEISIQKRDILQGGRAYNIGGGTACTMSILEIVEMLREEGLDFRISFDNWRPGDQKVFVSNNNLVGKELGWRPKIQPAEGVKRLIQWVKEHQDLIRTFFQSGFDNKGFQTVGRNLL